MYHLAQNGGYKLRSSAVRKVATTLKQQQQQKQQRDKSRCPAAEKRIAAAIRDLGASEYTFREQIDHENNDPGSASVRSPGHIVILVFVTIILLQTVC